MPAMGWEFCIWAFVLGFFFSLGWGICSLLLSKLLGAVADLNKPSAP